MFKFTKRGIVSVLAALAVGGCATQDCNQAASPTNDPADFTTCTGFTAPDGSPLRCYTPQDQAEFGGGEQCPLEGHYCIMVPVTPEQQLRRRADAGRGR